MRILRRPKVWTKERPANETRRSTDLTPEEHAKVRRALNEIDAPGFAALFSALKER